MSEDAAAAATPRERLLAAIAAAPTLRVEDAGVGTAEAAHVLRQAQDEGVRQARDEGVRQARDEGGRDDDGCGPPEPDSFDDLGPSDEGDESVDAEIVKLCAKLDHSDTDNAKRLLAHFGADLTVLEREGAPGGDWLAWDGKFWDLAAGAARATMLAQRIGGRIALEADHLAMTPPEARAVKRAAEFLESDKSDDAKRARLEAKHARENLEARQKARRRFAVSSKNQARVKAMLEMAAPHLRKPSRAFNSDPMLIVTETHTLRLIREPDLECPDPDAVRYVARIDALPEHRRSDYATGLAPTPYDEAAKAPKFLAFLDRCLPDLNVRRTVQQYCGAGLIGVLPQRLMFHHGFGANGKSVFLAVIMGVIGKSYGVALPKESILGQGERGAGQASPDLVRLFGKRSVRVDELKEGEALREDLVKRLTGGDDIVVRGLYSGYLEFPNVASPHMSGNGFPRIDGTDNGIWRRMLVVHWSVTIAPEERREFDEFVASLLTERAGVFNWMLAGALDFLANGFFVAEPVTLATAAYREDMDPIGRFVADCVEPRPGQSVKARAMYEAYVSWAKANAVHVCFETKFGREMAKRFVKGKDGIERTMSYFDCALHDVPARPDEARDTRADLDD